LYIRVKDIPTLVPLFRSCTHSNPKFHSGGPGRAMLCHVWVTTCMSSTHSCKLFARHSLMPLFTSCTHGNPKFHSIGLGQLGQGGSSHVVSCVGARAHMVMPKILSCDHPCVFCMFVRPIFSTLPHAFIRVVHPWKPQISFRSCAHGNTKFRSGHAPMETPNFFRVGRVMPCVVARANTLGQARSSHQQPVRSCRFVCG